MAKKKFVDEFKVNVKEEVVETIGYEIFSNKQLLEELRNKIIQNLIDNNKISKDINEYIKEEINKTLEGYNLTIVERNYVYDLIVNEITGYGPITELLNDDNITEIMVNGSNNVYVEIDGKIFKENEISFINDEHVIRTVQRMIGPLGKTIDAANPMVDARLKDGSRINAIIEPLSTKGPILTIRKFKSEIDEIEDLLKNGTMTSNMALFLEASVKAKLNIIISGGTGSGKTTLLNVLSSFIDKDERIITIEDAAELKLRQNHVVTLETRGSNYEKDSEVTIRDLVINSLRMRPDRIIIGEVRGKETFDMLQAMNTGHNGGMTTLHANSPVDALNRIETMVLMAGMEIPIKAIRDYIENAIDLVIQIERLSDGKRRITNISEVVGIENNEIELKTIFEFIQKDVTKDEVIGEFTKSKVLPKITKKIEITGQKVTEIFK